MTMLKNKQLLRCVVPGEPPRATSQQKGLRVVPAKGQEYKLTGPPCPHCGMKTAKMFPMHFTKVHVQAAKDMLAAQFARFRPGWQIEGAVRVCIYWVFKHPTTHKKAEREQLIPKDTRPDLDNLEKLLIDAIADMYFMDDAQIAFKETGKVWGPKPCIVLEIWQ